jgi:ectoine hydroxylase-related dioxygenase (phytanoyl-CoA dioxygenase family)
VLHRFSSTDDLWPFYRENGYVVVSDLFDAGVLEAAKEDVLSLFATGLRVTAGTSDLLSLIVERYDSDRAAWQRCAKRMQDMLGVYRLSAGPAVEEVLRGLSLARPMISTRPEVRMDMPSDDRYTQPWHQDWRSGQGSLNSATIWVPLHDVDAANGAIEIVPGSHLLGYLDSEEIPNPRRFSIPEESFDASGTRVAEVRLGEAVIFSQMLVHRSGHNTSAQPRITVQLRFGDYAEPHFVDRGLPTPVGSEFLWSPPPHGEQMREVYAAA